MKMKWLAIGIILLIVGTCIIPATSQEIEKPISASRGNWLYVGGSGPGNYTRIQDAIDNASDGDSVYVYDDSSPYYENLLINKTINLLGEDKKTTIIDGGGIKYVISIIAHSVNITGFWVQNSIWPYAGFDIYSTNNTISDNYISNHKFSGISIRNSSNIISRNNIFDNNDDGIYALDYSNIIISENIFLNGNRGIYFQGTSDSKISRNIFLNNYGTCMLIGFGLGNNISCNLIEGNSLECIYLLESQYTNFYSNILNDTHDNQVIRIQKSSNNYVYNNTISNNSGIGIEVFQFSNNNSFYHNNFINNFQNVYDECANDWDNGYPSCGNYWDNYISDDAFWGQNQEMNGSDGVGDIPYDISGGDNKDMYPLMEPYAMTRLTFRSSGGFGINGHIMNVGNTTAFRVCWRVTVTGGFILLGRDTLREIPKPLLPGEEVPVKSKMILGFGAATLAIMFWADNTPLISGNWTIKVFLFFISIL